jgi:hypothetical protein
VLSNLWLVAIVAAILWFPLRRLRPTTPSSILLVTSVTLATAMFTSIVAAMGALPWSAVLRAAAVSAVALSLFYTGMAVWAYLLILHAAYVVVQRCTFLQSPDLTEPLQRSNIGTIGLQLLIIWMLISYLRTPVTVQPPPSPNENA